MSRQSDRRLVAVTSVLLVASTLFPVVAAVVQPEPTPRWAGLADVAVALVTVGFGFTIATRARERFDDRVVRSAFRVYRSGATTLLALMGIYFVAGDRIGWHILMPGLAWRAWLLVWVLPAALTLWEESPRA